MTLGSPVALVSVEHEFDVCSVKIMPVQVLPDLWAGCPSERLVISGIGHKSTTQN
jgi:hypothetical protein